jgi:hypothetical protein
MTSVACGRRNVDRRLWQITRWRGTTSATNQARRFKVTVLRPLQVVLLLSVAAFLFEGMW